MLKKSFDSRAGSSRAYQQPNGFAVQALLLEPGDKRAECGWLIAKQRDPLFRLFVVQRDTLAGEPRALVKICLAPGQVRLANQTAGQWCESRVEKPFRPACSGAALYRRRQRMATFDVSFCREVFKVNP